MAIQLPEFPVNTVFYAGGTTLFPINKKLYVHVIEDVSSESYKPNYKLPGGCSQHFDYDDDLWLQIIKEQLMKFNYSEEEIGKVAHFFKNKPLTVYDRTYIREYLSETGYVPVNYVPIWYWKLKGNKPGRMGKDFYQVFFANKKTWVARYECPEPQVDEFGMCVLTSINPEVEIKSLDENVTKPRISMLDSDAVEKLSGRHKVPLKLIIQEECIEKREIFASANINALEQIKVPRLS